MELPFEADLLFIDGPVAVCIHRAEKEKILAAFDRLSRLVMVAAEMSLPTNTTKELEWQPLDTETPPPA